MGRVSRPPSSRWSTRVRGLRSWNLELEHYLLHEERTEPKTNTRHPLSDMWCQGRREVWPTSHEPASGPQICRSRLSSVSTLASIQVAHAARILPPRCAHPFSTSPFRAWRPHRASCIRDGIAILGAVALKTILKTIRLEDGKFCDATAPSGCSEVKAKMLDWTKAASA